MTPDEAIQAATPEDISKDITYVIKEGIFIMDSSGIETDHFIIGFGGNMKTGKTTAADMAVELLNQWLPEQNGWNYVQKRSWATKLKEVAISMGWDGEKDERGRRLLQTLGTEVGREYDPNMWIKHLTKSINTGPGLITVIDDCRFPNEVEWVNRHGVSVLIQRPAEGELPFGSSHASETLMNQCPWTIYLINDGDLVNLQAQVLALVVRLVKQYPAIFAKLHSNNPFI